MRVRSGPGPDNKLLVESYKAKRGSSADGLVVGHLARKARDAGSSSAQRYTFCLYEKFTSEKIIIYLRKVLIQRMFTRTKRDVRNVVILYM